MKVDIHKFTFGTFICLRPETKEDRTLLAKLWLGEYKDNILLKANCINSRYYIEVSNETRKSKAYLKDEILNITKQIKEEIQPVIEHLLDLGHELSADHLLSVRDNLVYYLENMET